MRPPEEVDAEIADMTPEERGHLIRRVMDDPDRTDAGKDIAIKFIMLLGLLGERIPVGGSRRKPN